MKWDNLKYWIFFFPSNLFPITDFVIQNLSKHCVISSPAVGEEDDPAKAWQVRSEAPGSDYLVAHSEKRSRWVVGCEDTSIMKMNKVATFGDLHWVKPNSETRNAFWTDKKMVDKELKPITRGNTQKTLPSGRPPHIWRQIVNRKIRLQNTYKRG